MADVDSFVSRHRGLLDFLGSVTPSGKTLMDAMYGEVQKIQGLEATLGQTAKAASSALQDAAAAGAHAKRATTTLYAFMNTGVVTTAHGNIFSRLGQVEANGKGAIDLINVIMRLAVQRGSPPSVPSPTSSSVDMSSLFSKEQSNTMFARRDTDIERVRQLLKGGGFTTGVGTFESVTDVEVFVVCRHSLPIADGL